MSFTEMLWPKGKMGQNTGLCIEIVNLNPTQGLCSLRVTVPLSGQECEANCLRKLANGLAFKIRGRGGSHQNSLLFHAIQ